MKTIRRRSRRQYTKKYKGGYYFINFRNFALVSSALILSCFSSWIIIHLIIWKEAVLVPYIQNLKAHYAHLDFAPLFCNQDTCACETRPNSEGCIFNSDCPDISDRGICVFNHLFFKKR